MGGAIFSFGLSHLKFFKAKILIIIFLTPGFECKTLFLFPCGDLSVLFFDNHFQ